MDILTFAAIKGGVGKTTLTYNFGEYLAKQGKKILMIDLDHQCNLSETYQVDYSDPRIINGTINNVFIGKGDSVVIAHTHNPNVDIIPGYIKLDETERSLETHSNKEFLLHMWLRKYYEPRNLGNYDYVLIDCRPDFSTATKNAIVVSDTILSPITPTEHGYQAKFNLAERFEKAKQEIVNPVTMETMITAKLLFVANMVKHNTKSSMEFIKVIEGENDVIATIPYREIFNRSTLDHKSIAQMEDEDSNISKNKKVYKQINEIFEKISKLI